MTRRLPIVAAFLLLAACRASAHPVPLESRSGYLPPPPAATDDPKDRYHPDMSKGFGGAETCDFVTPTPTVQKFIDDVDRPNSAVLARVVDIGRPRWNTQSGNQPSQAESDRMVETQNIEPSIYTPVTFEILRLYRGAPIDDRKTGLALSGRVGKFENARCPFARVDKLQIINGSEMVERARTYVVIFSNVTISGKLVLPSGRNVIQFIFAVHPDQRVMGYGGKLEPLPS
jgi:hypothetical protein